MSLLTLDDVSLHLGGKPVFEAVSLQITNGDRIGLIGPNGSGKTSLLRLLVGEQMPDGGAVHRRRGLRIGYLPQELAVEGGRGLLRYVIDSVPGRSTLDEQLADVERAMHELEGNASDPAQADQMVELAAEIAELHERIAHFKEHYSEHEAKRILTGLGFEPSDLTRDLGEFSGGWRMRAVLASLLFQRPDLLLLDEPTNHLDMPSVAWLSGFLRRYPGSFVLISHDREFLNEQIERVVSLEVEGVRSYPGNYDHYEKQRSEELTVLEARKRNLDREREHMQRFVDRFRAKASKATQAQSRLRALEKMETIELPNERKKLRFRFPPCERTGRDVLRAEGIGKSFGEHVVLRDVNVSLVRGEKVAILGRNGAGKTTLLRILAGELPPSTGEVTIGTNVKLGYYAQHHVDVLDPKRTAFETVDGIDREGKTRAALGAMQFSGDDIDKKIGVLSGGEKARVALARLLVDPGNVLLMDEPTNHLDLDSSERLGEALALFEGTLLFVSHNRSFVRKLATQIWHVEDAHVQVYAGSFEEYLYSMEKRVEAAVPVPVAVRPKAPEPAKPAEPRSRFDVKEKKRREAESRKKLAPLKKRVTQLEERIDELETAQRQREADLADPEVYKDTKRRDETLGSFHSGKVELEKVTAEWMKAQEELDALMARES